MLLSPDHASQWVLAMHCVVATAFGTVTSGNIGHILPSELSAVAEARTPSHAGGGVDQPVAHAEDEVVQFSVDALPPRETYVAMQRIRYLPGARLAEQPSDGPKFINVLSGELTIRAPVPGVTLSRPSAGRARTSTIEPGVDQLVSPGTITMIPAGIPAQLSNTSDTPVEWIQLRVETPATLCACGEDRSAVDMELLSSQTLPDPFLPPVIVSFTRLRLDPAVPIASPPPGAIQFAGAVNDGETLLRSDDGSVRNYGTMPIEVVVATIARVDAADQK